MIDFLLLDVKNINSHVSRSNFAETDLENLADTIIESGGIIKPLVVKQAGIDSYRVVDGHFEYYAAVKAREKNPRKGEMINAFVIVPKSEDLIIRQAEIIKGQKLDSSPATIQASANEKSQPLSSNTELSSLEKQLSELRIELGQEREKIYTTLKNLEGQIPKQITPLEAFNTLSLLELTLRLKTANFNGKKAEQVAEGIEKERSKKPFESLSDVIERVKIKSGTKQVKGISGEKMIAIVDSWSKLLFLQ
jgi:hypothetical protein